MKKCVSHLISPMPSLLFTLIFYWLLLNIILFVFFFFFSSSSEALDEDEFDFLESRIMAEKKRELEAEVAEKIALADFYVKKKKIVRRERRAMRRRGEEKKRKKNRDNEKTREVKRERKHKIR